MTTLFKPLPTQVLLRTLQAPNSTRYKHMIDELFIQERSLAQEYSYFMDPPDAKRGSQPTKKVGRENTDYYLRLTIQ